jgi:hypothetical protein
MHGARGGAPKGKRNVNYRHGANTKLWMKTAHEGRLVDREARASLKKLEHQRPIKQGKSYHGRSARTQTKYRHN